MKKYACFFICFGFLWVHAGEPKASIGLEIGTGMLHDDDYNMPFLLKLKGKYEILPLKKDFLDAAIDIEFGGAANKYRNELPSDIVRGTNYVYRILQNYLAELYYPILRGVFEPCLGIGFSFINNIEAGYRNTFLYGGVLKPSLTARFRSISCSPYIRYQFLFDEDQDKRRYVTYGSSLAYNKSNIIYEARAWVENNEYKTRSGDWLTSRREPKWGVTIGITMKLQRAED